MKQMSTEVYRANEIKAITLQTNIFPGFQQIAICTYTLKSKPEWISKIHEVLFRLKRLNFLVELDKLGWHTAMSKPHEALIFGKQNLKAKNTTVTSWDLRTWLQWL